MMVQSFAEANRVLKSGGQMTVVYAHKTTLGWTTLVDALRRANVKPATRLATAILVFSFGGLRRPGAGAEESLPSGVTETELLSSCVGPDLDSITANAVLSELRSTCLYLHFDGIRYCFKKDPNVTKLIEDAEQEVTREDTANPKAGLVRFAIKELLNKKLAGQLAALVWTETSGEIP